MPRPRPTTPKTPEPTAAEMYAARRADIDRLLAALKDNLRLHAKDHHANPRNWGLTGDLGKVREDLINIVAFMTEMEPEEVAATLR